MSVIIRRGLVLPLPRHVSHPRTCCVRQARRVGQRCRDHGPPAPGPYSRTSTPRTCACGCRKCHPTFWRGTMHIETRRFPPPYDRCSSGTTKSRIVCLRRYDVPAHRQDRVDPLHRFNPFILFTGPDEVFGTHRDLASSTSARCLVGDTAPPNGAERPGRGSRVPPRLVSEGPIRDKHVHDFIGTRQQLFIDGQMVEAMSGKTFETINPATGEIRV
jgi:hypothetical protein